MIKQPLASTFVYEFNIDTNLVDRALEDILKKPTSVTSSNQLTQHRTQILFHKNNDNNFTPIFHKELFTQLQNCIDQVCELHFSQGKLAICDSWLTRTYFGEKSEMHSHSFSIFSGVLYCTEHYRAPTLFELEDLFYKKYEKLFHNTIKPQTHQLLSHPKKGKLLIFDSQIRHGILHNVNKNKSGFWRPDAPRYTIAFNTWFTGQIGPARTARLTSNVVDVEQQNQ